MIDSFYAAITGIEIEWQEIVEERAKLCAQYILDSTLETDAGRLSADSLLVLCHYLAAAAQRMSPGTEILCKDIAATALSGVLPTTNQLADAHSAVEYMLATVSPDLA